MTISTSCPNASTLAAYQSIIKLWLTPAFGHRVVSEIQLSDVQRLVMDLSDKVSAKTLKNCLTPLRVMLVGKKGASGVKRGFIRHDPTRGVELPSRHMEAIVSLSVVQVWQLIDVVATHGELGHAMAHMDAFMLIAQGESPKYICDQLGHSSIQVTFDVYGHLFPQSREEAAAKLQKAMFASRRSGFGSSLVANTENTVIDQPRHNSEKDG
jgi:hypothetical protein